MRTTLDIDEDVLLAAKERARRERRTAGEVVSELARRALEGEAVTLRSHRRSASGFRPFAGRGAVVTDALIDKLRDESGT